MEQQFKICKLEKEHKEEALEVMAEAFTTMQEPMYSLLNITAEEFKKSIIVGSDILNGLTTIAIDKSNNKIASVWVGDDYTDENDFDDDEMPEKIEPLFYLMDSLEEDYLEKRKIKYEDLKKGQILHIHDVATRKEYLRKGIGNVCGLFTMENAKRLGFSEIIAETTSSKSLAMSLKLGFTEYNSILYKDYEHEGVKYWEKAEEKFNETKVSVVQMETKDFDLKNFKINSDNFELIF